MKKTKLIIYILAVIFFLNKISNNSALAAVATAITFNEERDGSVLYTYQSSCESDAAKNQYGIIVPKGNKQVDKIYLYFHGYEASTPQSMCESSGHGLCANAAGLKDLNLAIIVPQGKDNIKSDGLSSDTKKMNCVVDEAKTKLQELKTNGVLTSVDNNTWIVAGHSDGWAPVKNYLTGHVANKTLLFDACYATGCEDIIKSGRGGSIFIYAGDDREPSYGTLKEAKTVYNNNKSGGIRMVLALKPKLDHFSIRSKCFLDHEKQDLCNGLGTLFSDQTTASPAPDTTDLEKLKSDLNARKPILEVNIPSLNFSDVKVSQDDTGTYLYIGWIPELISGIYKFLLAIVSIVAAVVIIIQGLRVITSGGGEGKTEAYKKILQSIIGLFIAWGSYAILFTINPALVQFNALKVKMVEKKDLFESFNDFAGPTPGSPTVDVPNTGERTAVCSDVAACLPLCKAAGCTKIFCTGLEIKAGTCQGITSPWQNDCKTSAFPNLNAHDILPPDSSALIPASRWPQMNNITAKPSVRATQLVIDGLQKASNYIDSKYPGKGYKIEITNCWRDYRGDFGSQCAVMMRPSGNNPVANGSTWPGANPHSAGYGCDLALKQNGKTVSGGIGDQNCSSKQEGNRVLVDVLTNATVGAQRLGYEAWHFQWAGFNPCYCSGDKCPLLPVIGDCYKNHENKGC
jgi:hypothetical protein